MIGGGSSIGTSSSYYPTPKVPRTPIPKYKPYKQPTRIFGKFPAYGRRFGTFKLIGYGKTPQQAVGIGRGWAGKTLGATFKVPSFKGSKIGGFRTKKTKEGFVFIEPRRRRLSTKTEVGEIFSFKRAKAKPRKSKSSKKKKLKTGQPLFYKKDDDTYGYL